MPELEARGNIFANGAKFRPYTLPYRFECLPTCTFLGGMNAETKNTMMVHGRENTGLLAVGEDSSGLVGTPHDIGCVGGDLPVMALGATEPSLSHWSLQALFTHETSDPFCASPYPLKPKAGVDLTISFGAERAVFYDNTHLLHKGIIGHRSLRFPAQWWRLRRLLPFSPGVKGGRTHTPCPTDPAHSI